MKIYAELFFNDELCSLLEKKLILLECDERNRIPWKKNECAGAHREGNLLNGKQCIQNECVTPKPKRY